MQPNSKLLINYGIVDESNPHDRLPLSCALDRSLAGIHGCALAGVRGCWIRAWQHPAWPADGPQEQPRGDSHAAPTTPMTRRLRVWLACPRRLRVWLACRAVTIPSSDPLYRQKRDVLAQHDLSTQQARAGRSEAGHYTVLSCAAPSTKRLLERPGLGACPSCRAAQSLLASHHCCSPHYDPPACPPRLPHRPSSCSARRRCRPSCCPTCGWCLPRGQRTLRRRSLERKRRRCRRKTRRRC